MVAERYVVVLCGGQRTSPRQFEEQARGALAEFTVFGCGADCHGQHHLLQIEEEQ